VSGEGQELNKSEEATPFKLRKARERGQVARGMDLGFVASLLALVAVGLIAGQSFFASLAELMRRTFLGGIAKGADPNEALAIVGATYWTAFKPLVTLGAALILMVLALEIIQLRGIIFTAHPLKPDFQRLNPARGLKRLFSLRMLKETLKNVLKLALYGAAAWYVISASIDRFGPRVSDAARLAGAFEASVIELLAVFVGLAFVFMVIDQVIVRQEFRKQMRMSRRELTRETREREGEPRLKQRRRDLHAEMREQAEGLGKLAGSDMLVVNPEHFAVALHYDPRTMSAPEVGVKGRNHFAQLMKRKAFLLSIPVIPHARLARTLHADCRVGQPILPEHYRDVARLYHGLRDAPAHTPSEG
jgi:flagellar biosynthetic protein FlhB